MNSPDTPPPRTNPLVPSSTGALLAEEWTVNPHSVLPSFLELTLMDEVQRSKWQALIAIINWLKGRMTRLSQEPDPTESVSLRWKLWSMLGGTKLAGLSQNILTNYSPEIRFLFVYWLELKTLQSPKSATLAESLYGGKRVRLVAPEGSDDPSKRRLQPMSEREGVRLSLLLALGHYLVERGDWLYKNLSNPDFTALSTRSRKLIKVLYPFLYATAKGINLLQRWRYLLGQSVFFDAYSEYLNLAVRRLTAQDQAPAPSPSDGQTGAGTPSAIQGLSATLGPVMGSEVFRRMSIALVTSLVGLGWMGRVQSIRREIRQRRILQDPDKSVPPPAKPLPDKAPIIKNCPLTHCPLCRQPRVHPTASTGGYVFCLTCLTNYIKETPQCPISGKECSESDIVRLFEPQNV